MARRKRRSRTLHAGVKLRTRTLPNGDRRWRAHWRDPHTGKEQAFTLDPHLYAAREAREAWARAKAESLARERADLAAGRKKRTLTPPADAVRDYLDRCARTLRPGTVESYAISAREFSAWAESARLKAVEHLDPPALLRLRDAILATPAYGHARGATAKAKRARKPRKRAPRAINNRLGDLSVMLRDGRRRGLLPLLDNDAIGDGLRRVKAEKSVVLFLRTPELRDLLRAALRPDAARFAATRAEHAGNGTPGTTPRHAPAAPFLATVLLTGMRFGEAAALEWAWVRLDAAPPVIELPAAATKTAEGRRIDLGICPALVRLLAALRVQAGGAARVFPAAGRNWGKALLRRLPRYGAPAGVNFQMLRRTCGTFLACSGLYGEAGVWRAARRLGHGVAVAEKCYYRQVDVDPKAATLEAAMGIEGEVAEVLARIGAAPGDVAPADSAALAGTPTAARS